MFENERYNTSVFHCQQAAEKAVKALLFHNNINGWGHSIHSLLEKYKEIKNKNFDDLKRTALSLDKHYITTHYPDTLPNIVPHEAYNREEAELAINQAKKIINFVIKELKKSKQILKTDLKDYLIKLSEIINKKIPLECVILFGSRAREDYLENSDLDMIFIGDFKEPFINRSTLIYEFYKLSFGLDSFCYRVNEFDIMFHEGIVSILDAIDYGICILDTMFIKNIEIG